jgi:hypothetical protein
MLGCRYQLEGIAFVMQLLWAMASVHNDLHISVLHKDNENSAEI